VSTPERARVQTLHELQQFKRSNIDRTCVQYFARARIYRDTLTWDNTAACVQIRPSAAERGFGDEFDFGLDLVLDGIERMLA